MIHMTSQNIKISQPTAVAIGKFDGVHRGHMALLDELKLVASYRGLAPLVLTFDPHPIAFFKRARLPLILDPFEKVSLFETLGIDYYLEYRFDEQFAKTEPEDFLYNVVHKKLNARALVVAEGYRFGRGGAGDVSLLRRVCGGLGIEVQEIGHVVHEGHKISSDYLRKLVAGGDFELFKALCGRDFSVTGKARGSALIPHPDKLLPPDGVYETIVSIDGKAQKQDVQVDRHKITLIENIDNKNVIINFKK